MHDGRRHCQVRQYSERYLQYCGFAPFGFTYTIHLLMLHQGYIEGQHWDLSLNYGQSNAGGRAHGGWNLMCKLCKKKVGIWMIT